VKIESAPRRRFTIAGEGKGCERVPGFGGMAPLSIGQARLGLPRTTVLRGLNRCILVAFAHVEPVRFLVNEGLGGTVRERHQNLGLISSIVGSVSAARHCASFCAAISPLTALAEYRVGLGALR
jgi:hypothetical protein